MVDGILTEEQRKVRDKALVNNLRFKFPQLSNYADEDIVKAYDDWFLTAENVGNDYEEEFLEFLQPEDK
jgi:hypothetical protein